LRSVPLAAPLDLDGDGLDDVFELFRPLYLNPLDPNDGPQAPETPTLSYPLESGRRIGLHVARTKFRADCGGRWTSAP
jgi:hypothetical protein